MAKANLKPGFMVEWKYRKKWETASDWNPKIVGWTPAFYDKKSKAERFKKRLEKTGIGVDVKEGKVVMKKVPVRISCVEYRVSGKSGKRVFDYNKVRCPR